MTSVTESASTLGSGGKTAGTGGLADSVPAVVTAADPAKLPADPTVTVDPAVTADPTVTADPIEADRRAPGRPRSARADGAIVEAALDLLAEGTSLEAMSIEAIATRAGVGKATIYRRWPNKEALIVDAVAALKGPLPELEGLSIRDDLVRLLGSIGAARASRAGRVMPCLIPELARNEELARRYHTLTEPRRELMRSVLRGGMESGQLRADLDLEMTCAMLVGPMVSQSVLNWHPGVDITKMPEQIVDAILPGLMAAGSLR